MPNKIIPHLMFDGTAKAAMDFYVSLFVGSKIIEYEKYGAGEQGAEGSIKVATFMVSGQEFMCIDTPVKHAFTFTPSIAIHVECESEEELHAAYKELSAGGELLMPLDNYGFSKRFGWVNDRFGVSWQLNLK